MKTLVAMTGLLCALTLSAAYGQESETVVNSEALAKERVTEMKAVQRAVEKEENRIKKAEKEAKKAAKEQKKKEKLAKAIKGKEKSIRKNEAKVKKLENKLLKDEAKGKLSPLAKAKMNTKIQKLKATVVKDKNKLKRLIKKQ